LAVRITTGISDRSLSPIASRNAIDGLRRLQARWAQPLVTLPLVLATLVALTLNLVFRSGFLIRRYVDKITLSSNNGLNEIRLHLDH
jgi:hypothetical protein